MRYYEARQRADSQWDWTVMHDKKIRATAPCLPASKDSMCHHKTREEAERHFYDEEVKKATETVFDDSTLNRCEIKDCEEYTHKGMKTHLLLGIPVLLCDTHRNNQGIMEARPFKTGMQIWKS